MKKVLILESWYGSPESDWFPWLKNKLEKMNYQVFIPDLPTIRTKLPRLDQQIECVEKTIEIDKETIVIGHSLGALVALRLGERHQFQKMFLVAGWDFDDLFEAHRFFWQAPISHKMIKQNVKEVFCLSSDNDRYVTAFTANEMSKRLGRKLILVKGAGHFTKKDGIVKIPQILKYV